MKAKKNSHQNRLKAKRDARAKNDKQLLPNVDFAQIEARITARLTQDQSWLSKYESSYISTGRNSLEPKLLNVRPPK